MPAIKAVEEKYHYELMPPDASGGYELKKVIDIEKVEGKKSEDIYADISVYIPFTQSDIEYQNKSRRSAFLDAYRKYQAAVNYGEVEKAAEVDNFIFALMNKDWTVF